MPPRSRVFPWVLLAGFVVAAGCLMAYRKMGGAGLPGVVAAELPDGARLRLWKATFGTNHELVLGRFPGLDDLRRLIPAVQRVFGAPTERLRGGWGENGLCLFYTGEDGQGFPMRNLPWFTATVDEHGCKLGVDSGRGESRFGGTNFAHQYSRVYPRRIPQFEAQVGELGSARTGSVSFLIHNPHPWTGPSWVPEAIPAVREVDELRVTYHGFQGSDRWPWPKFEVEQGGQVRSEWRAGRVYFRDVTGNETQSPSLCRHEAAWEIEASFERVPEFEFGPDEAWTIHAGSFPEPGKVLEFEGNRTMQGVRVGIRMLGAPGHYELEKKGGAWSLIRGEAPKDESIGNGSSWGSDSNRDWMNLTRSKPWAMLDLHGLPPDLTWKLVARDAAGRCFPNAGWSVAASTYTVDLEIPKDVVVTELRFIIQRWRTVAFKVAPPKILAP